MLISLALGWAVSRLVVPARRRGPSYRRSDGPLGTFWL